MASLKFLEFLSPNRRYAVPANCHPWSQRAPGHSSVVGNRLSVVTSDVSRGYWTSAQSSNSCCRGPPYDRGSTHLDLTRLRQ